MSIIGNLALSAFMAAVVAIGMAASTPAWSQYCEGRVHGLSGRYNLATGSGFLAVRARPTASSRMVGQLFNGDRVEIFDRRGNWYRIAMGGIDGWSHARWLRNSCRY